jgi:DNA repair exonuclease SbcCD ATPase subunit
LEALHHEADDAYARCVALARALAELKRGLGKRPGGDFAIISTSQSLEKRAKKTQVVDQRAQAQKEYDQKVKDAGQLIDDLEKAKKKHAELLKKIEQANAAQPRLRNQKVEQVEEMIGHKRSELTSIVEEGHRTLQAALSTDGMKLEMSQ